MKSITGYNNKYKITKDGRVWSEVSKRYLTAHTNHSGYKIVSLCGLGKNKQRIKTHTIHRLLALAYLPLEPNKDKVNHKNGIKTDNRLSNLEWSSQKENVRHAWSTGLSKAKFGDAHHNVKLSDQQVAEVKGRIDFKYGTMTRLAKEYGVSISLISLIGRNYRRQA